VLILCADSSASLANAFNQDYALNGLGWFTALQAFQNTFRRLLKIVHFI
jgi:hypothetical protein